jgi:hypothetical protein
MKKILVALLLVSGMLVGVLPGAMTAAFAQKAPEPLGIEAELNAALQEMASAQLGTLTAADLVKLEERLSVAQQKLQYVQRARRTSFMIPGAGQFMTGDALGGSLFLAGDIAVVAGSLIGAYFLLPTSVQFDNLDYLNAPLSTIETTWKGNSVLSYLPSFGVLLGGAILKGVLGHISAVSAAREARQNIADGKVTFTPSFDFDRHGFGMGMRMRF